MDQQYNIANVIMDLDESIEDRIAIRTPDNTLTYGQLRHLTTCFALHLRERGVGRSSCVAISTTDVRVAIASTLAIALLGGSWVQANRWSFTNEALGITQLLHGGSEELPTAINTIEIDQSWTKYPDGIDPSLPIEFDGYASSDDTALIAQSSGSTGEVKFMRYSQRSIFKHVKKERHRYFGGFPPIHACLFHHIDFWGYYNHMRTMFEYGTILVGGDCDFWVQSGVNTVTGTPALFVQSPYFSTGVVGNRVGLVRCGGAGVSLQLLAELLNFSDGVNVGYGCTEAGSFCDRILTSVEQFDGRLGDLYSDMELEIISDLGETVHSPSSGTVRMRSETIVNGYIGDPEATAAAFRDGWFCPGDIGYLTDDGQVVITGRVTDILNLGGVKVNAVSIDEVIQAQADVLDGICFAKPDDLGVDALAAIVTLTDGADPKTVCEAIRANCRKELGAPYVPNYIYVSDQVPRNERGKATRHLAVEAIKDMEPAWVLPEAQRLAREWKPKAE